jgi:hypothetical protein
LRLPLLLPTLLLAACALGQTPPRVQAVQIAQPPVIDGVIHEEEWAEASKLTDFWDAVANRSPIDRTDAFLAYDQEAIYVAFRAYDPQPGSLVGREVTPGAEFDGEDTFTFRINPFGNRTWDGQSEFSVNVLNTQSERISGGRTSKREWRGEWQSATMRLVDGWSAEMRIPWKVLNYPAGASLMMDIQLERYQARTRVGSMWANASLQFRPELFGIWEGVQPPARSRPFEFLAYIAPEFEKPDGRDPVYSLRAGMDIRKALTSTLTGLVSIAPDFRNIESEIAGIEFTRTERYLDESRPFFTEGGGFLNLTGPFTFGRMFYSRRIENFDVGAKVFGKIDDNLSVGALTTYRDDALASVIQLSGNYGPRKGANLYFTSYDVNGLQNQAIGGGLSGRRGSFGFDGQFAEEKDLHGQADHAGSVAVSYEVPKIFAILRYQQIDPGFEPALGYIPWRDRKGAYLYANYDTQYRSGALRSMSSDLFVTHYETYSGDPQQEGFEPSLNFTTRGDTRFGLGFVNMRYFGVLDQLYSLSGTLNASNRFRRFGFYVQKGRRGDDDSLYASAGMSLRVFRKLDVGLNYAHQDYLGTSDQAILTTSYEIDPTRSVSARVVQREEGTNAYLAYRRAGAAGIEYFVILGDPNAQRTSPRLSLKVVWAF